MLQQDTLLSGAVLAILAFFAGSLLFRTLNWLMINYIFSNSYTGVREQFIYILGAIFCLIPFHVLGRQHRLRSQQGLVGVVILITFGILFYFNMLNFF